MPSPHPDLVIIASQTSASTFRAEDRTDSRFYVYGTLSSGLLRFEVVRRVGADKSVITGREFFDAMMAHFGAKVRIIEARWNNSDPNKTSNLDRFNKARASGKLTEEQAALVATRTGQWADDLGFSNVSIVDVDPPDPPGQHTSVVIQFSK
jgi:hypothetical protein